MQRVTIDSKQRVTINSNFNNINQFIDSLFDQEFRTIESLKSAISTGSFTAAFSNEVYKIIPVWLATWQKAQGDPYSKIDYGHSQLTDQQTFEFLSNYIKQNTLSLYVPQIELVSLKSSTLPVYKLKEYKKLTFFENNKWNYESVSNFLELFLFGAHFVIIQHPKDLLQNTYVADFYQAFLSSKLFSSSRPNPGHSHYTSFINSCGYYFPSVKSDQALTESTPFNLSWLLGLTQSKANYYSSSANVFFQLEGWQSTVKDFGDILDVIENKGRYNADYQKHEQTLWNISTYGACAYSEKRGTTIFLAPNNWMPKPNKKTIMPPYVGAESSQNWLHRDLVSVS
jgi:hypothetical protein